MSILVTIADAHQHNYRTFMTKPAASAPTISLKVRRLETSDVEIIVNSALKA
jgi:hypothetical protein